MSQNTHDPVHTDISHLVGQGDDTLASGAPTQTADDSSGNNAHGDVHGRDDRQASQAPQHQTDAFQEQVQRDASEKETKDAFDIEAWGSHPEAEPRPAPKETSDHIEMHETAEHEPAPEVTGYVDHQPQKVPVPEDLKELGVEQTEHPIQYPKQNTVKVPLSDDKILQGKKKPLDSSFRWLAEMCLYLLHKANIRLKDAHGKAERIFEK